MNKFNDNRVVKLFRDEWSRSLIFLVIGGISIVISFFDDGMLPFDAAWIAVILCGIPIIIEAVIGVVKHHDVTAGVLVSIALIAAVSIGEIFAAGEVAFIMALGELLEQMTVNKARKGIERLVALAPPTARVITENGENIIPVSQVRIGDIIRVLAGETIPTDGRILKGRTSVDQSLLTGESLPVDKEEGDDILSGAVNQLGVFDMIVTVTEENSSLQRMIRLVQAADADKTKMVRMVDKWAKWIVAFALLVAVFAWLILDDVIKAVTVLVVFCPCALVLATPTAIVAAIGNVTRYGMIVKNGDAIERLSSIGRLVFDKTGTLTYGKPKVLSVNSFDNGYTQDEILRIAASAEMNSEHILGQAIIDHSKERGIAVTDPSEFNVMVGRGVSAVVSGKRILAGNQKLMIENNIKLGGLDTSFNNISNTVVYISSEGSLIGSIVLADTIRESISSTVDELKGMGLELTMLTGDNEDSAKLVAEGICISDVVSNCMPENKVDIIKGYENKGDRVCIIGDGINDAPALKTATVGIAMGGIGSDIAIDAADIVLVRDDIENIPHLIRLSRRTFTTIKLNLTFSMVLNFVAIGLALTGILDPVTGALVHNAGSIFVVLNSALLLSWKHRGNKVSDNYQNVKQNISV